MADAKKCDRCGVLFEPYDTKIYENIYPHRYTRITSKIICQTDGSSECLNAFDLCSECAKSFDRWLNFEGGVSDEQSK